MILMYNILDNIFPPSAVSVHISKINPEILKSKYPKASPHPHSSFIHAFFDYRDKFISQMIWELKFYKNKEVAKLCASIFYEKILNISKINNINNFILLPVPISKQKRRKRGFNHTELLCEEIIKLDINTNNILSYQPKFINKIRNTKNQHDIKNKQERLINLKGAFSLNQFSVISDQNVIIIDDVLTTGATILEIKKVLENSVEVKSIYAITIAH